ncbi:MAG: radical SAM protein [Deltaproteobacteria bacterium]|nr:radical SAM protein [Deltaproteobacteria bacterium]
MRASNKLTGPVRDLLSREQAPPFRAGGPRVGLVHPTPYKAAMASLGYQWILSLLRDAGLSAERIFLPEDMAGHLREKVPAFSLESFTPASSFPILAVSMAYELELADLIRLLDLSGIPPLRADRGPDDPVILLGGPITWSNPHVLAPFVDAMLLGEADHTVVPAVSALFNTADRGAWLQAVAALPGGYVPELHGLALPQVAQAPDDLLPARSFILTPDSALPNMFLVEGERGCHRTCTFCVMRRQTGGGMRVVPPEKILSLVPPHATKVGLVGAGISDHPELVPLLQSLRDRGLGVGVSSLRADRIVRRPELARVLREAGSRTLTVASDAASGRLRQTLAKGIREDHLIQTARLSRELGYEVLKVYMMLGLPGETDEDLDELVRFTRELSGYARVALGVAPFVAKRHTPLDGAPFAGIKLVEQRLKRLQIGLRGKAEVRAVSARWAWVEYMLAQGGEAQGLAVLEAVRAGGRFTHFKRALEATSLPKPPG